jgi:CheY-like chemotaxis protein
MAHQHPAVLVVEDDLDIQMLVAEVLESEGYAVRTARNGRLGIESLREFPPDVVVLDLMMPEVDGFGVLDAWRELPEPRPPVVVVSAFDGYLPLALKRGASAALRKPFDLDALLSSVRSALHGKKEPLPVEDAAARDESRRLRAVLELKLEQPAPTQAMDEFVRRVALIFDVPVCLVSIITYDRQYWHAFCGLSDDLAAARGTPREDSFCTHAVVAKAALIVQDAVKNPLFSGNRLVREEGLRFYAGVPLANRFGDVLGTVCLLDFRPRGFTCFDLELLSVLAKRVVAELEWREKRERPRAPNAAFRYLAWLDEDLDLLGREAFLQGLQVESLRAAAMSRELSLAVVVVPAERLRAAVADLKAALPSALLGRLGFSRIGLLAWSTSREELLGRAVAAAGSSAQVEALAVPRIAGSVDQFLQEAEIAAGSAGLR